MREVKITAGPLEFLARSYPQKIIHVQVERGGVVLEIPLGDYDLGGVGFEEATSVPGPGEILFP